jgi:hypothetical protein
MAPVISRPHQGAVGWRPVRLRSVFQPSASRIDLGPSTVGLWWPPATRSAWQPNTRAGVPIGPVRMIAALIDQLRPHIFAHTAPAVEVEQAAGGATERLASSTTKRAPAPATAGRVTSSPRHAAPRPAPTRRRRARRPALDPQPRSSRAQLVLDIGYLALLSMAVVALSVQGPVVNHPAVCLSRVFWRSSAKRRP